MSKVNFNNVLKRGNLQVIKSSEDNLVEGVTFHLYGTSLSGIAVDEYAVTDKNGVASFDDVLISGTNPYTIEEVDTAIRYVVPANQTAPINWKEVTTRNFTNILKKFSVTVTKSDREEGTPQGDATLAGAVYGIYKELQRVNRDVMEVLDNKDIIRVFPRTLSNTNTSLVLKTPKTKTSVRKIFLPSTVAQMLLERKKQIDEMKELFGDEYLDYDLVFCHSSGRPMEGQVINRALKKLIQDNDLPDVVFHSFRHASITYKLKWNGGDMKSVQGDSGHARMDMVADVYSHIIDEDRRYNAQKFEEQFYNAKGLKNAEEGKTAPMPKFETSVELLDPMAEVQKESEVEKEKPAENSTDENAALLTKLLSNPETAALLKALAKTI